MLVCGFYRVQGHCNGRQYLTHSSNNLLNTEITTKRADVIRYLLPGVGQVQHRGRFKSIHGIHNHNLLTFKYQEVIKI